MLVVDTRHVLVVETLQPFFRHTPCKSADTRLQNLVSRAAIFATCPPPSKRKLRKNLMLKGRKHQKNSLKMFEAPSKWISGAKHLQMSHPLEDLGRFRFIPWILQHWQLHRFALSLSVAAAVSQTCCGLLVHEQVVSYHNHPQPIIISNTHISQSTRYQEAIVLTFPPVVAHPLQSFIQLTNRPNIPWVFSGLVNFKA